MAKKDVLIVGGGPAGAVAGIVLAREGLSVVVAEKETFPRYHIGESMLPTVLPIMEFLGIREKVDGYGFIRKYGAYFKIKNDAPAGHLDLTKVSHYGYAFQVKRDEFDKLFLDHARTHGADVREGTRVTKIDFDGERPVSATLESNQGTEEVAFDHLVDASGASGVLATRYLKNRTFDESLSNLACGAYWKNCKPYVDEKAEARPGDFFMETCTDGSGWVWNIPLHDGTNSVGLCVHREHWKALRKRFDGDTARVYEHGLALCPDVMRLLEGAEKVTEVRTWADYAYLSDSFSGPGYRIAGDAGAFIDPMFSNGIHMAHVGALSAAASICAVRRGECTEEESANFHDRYTRRAYLRFAYTVAGIYKQMRNQDEFVMKGISKENFQLAFDFLLPVVSGRLDAGGGVSDEAVAAAVDFMRDTALEQHQIDTGNAKAQKNAQKSDSFDRLFSLAPVDGLQIRMEAGQLGLKRLTA